MYFMYLYLDILVFGTLQTNEFNHILDFNHKIIKNWEWHLGKYEQVN